MSKVNLTDDDVLSVSTDLKFMQCSTSTGAELMDIVQEWIFQQSQLNRDLSADWVNEGVICKVLLAAGGGWQKGKIRLRLEFTPDTPVSPLDDLRNNL